MFSIDAANLDETASMRQCVEYAYRHTGYLCTPACFTLPPESGNDGINVRKIAEGPLV